MREGNDIAIVTVVQVVCQGGVYPQQVGYGELYRCRVRLHPILGLGVGEFGSWLR